MPGSNRQLLGRSARFRDEVACLPCPTHRDGGTEGTRTLYLDHAMVALSQLSYSPVVVDLIGVEPTPPQCECGVSPSRLQAQSGASRADRTPDLTVISRVL